MSVDLWVEIWQSSVDERTKPGLKSQGLAAPRLGSGWVVGKRWKCRGSLRAGP